MTWNNYRERERGELNIGVFLALAIAGFGAIICPWSSPPVKIGLSAIGCGACAYQSVTIKRNRQKKSEFLESEKVRLQTLESSLKSLQTELDAKDKQIEASLEALRVSEVELASKKRVQEEELRASRALQEAELKALKEQQESEIARTQDQLLSEMDFNQRKAEAELKEKLDAQALAKIKELKDLEESELARMREAIAILEQEKLDLEQHIFQERERLAQLIEQEMAKCHSLIAETQEKITQDKAAAESDIGLEKQKWLSEMEEAEEALAEDYEKEKDKLLAELNALKASLKAESEEKYKSWLVPHIQEMDSKLREIEALKSTISMLKEQIAEDRDIKLCHEWGTTHGDRANAVLIWLKQQGVYADYVTSIVAPDGQFSLNFLPWEVGAKSEKAIKGLLIGMQVKFGLSEVPMLQPNGEARAWTLIFYPARARAIPLTDFYTQQLPEIKLGQTFQDIEPALREEVARRVNYQAQVAEMMAFRPAKLPKPTTFQITELEMLTIKWFVNWRGLATNGEEENVTTIEGLLYHAYGVTKGRSSHTYDPLMGETLAQRIRRVLQIIQTSEQTVEVEEEV